MTIRANHVAYSGALALVASLGVVTFVNFQPSPELEHRSLGLVVVMWIATFALPPFLVGLRAKESGATYGLLVGLVPLVVATVTGYRGPALVALAFYALAPLGGVIGQLVSSHRKTD